MNAAQRPPKGYAQIKEYLMDCIRAGEWQPGELLPTETELATRLKSSRMTVNRALRELAEDHILERKRKGGTRVSTNPIQQAKLQIPIISQQINQAGARYSYRLLHREIRPCDDHSAYMLGLRAGSRALAVRCLHLADDQPYQYEERWINLGQVPSASQELFNQISPNEWLVKTIPYTRAEHSFGAVNATKNQAELLAVNERDALFLTERRTWQGQAVVSWVRLYHPGSFRMRTDGL